MARRKIEPVSDLRRVVLNPRRILHLLMKYVRGVGYELKDCFGGVGEGCFEGYAEFAHGF
jgi:hypothetical protein